MVDTRDLEIKSFNEVFSNRWNPVTQVNPCVFDFLKILVLETNCL